MNYCFIIPKSTNSDEQGYYFPIGIAYVAASLKTTNRNVYTLNLNYKKGTTYEYLKKYLIENKIDFVATGGITSLYWQIYEILEAVKRISTKIITCVGGGIITSGPYDGMKALELVDYGIIGEGEFTICDLAAALEGKMDLSMVKGLIYRNDFGKYILNEKRNECMNLDDLPYPDYKGFEYDELLKRTMVVEQLVSGDNSRVATVCFSRSCPFNCTFCFHPSGTKYRRRSLKNIFMEIDYLIKEFNIKNINIVDELFLGNLKDIDDFCYEIKKRNIGFSVSLRVDMVNKKNLMLLRDSGCRSIIFGLESADNNILKSMRKRITIEQIDKALSLCNEVGVNFGGNFIFGDQAETKETANNTLRWWRDHPQYNNISLFMIRLYPGSALYDVACNKGIIKDKVDFIKKGCPLTNVSQMSDDDYKGLAVKIDMVHKKNEYKLDNAYWEYLGTGKVKFSAECPKCHKRCEWNGLDVFHNTINQVCNNCSNSIFINVFEYAGDVIRKKFMKLKERKVAIWPISNPAGALIQIVPEILEDENVFLIDSNKSGIKYEGKTINAPEIINSEDIKIIFITVATITAREIRFIIERDYPKVEKIFFAGDLIDEKFSL